MPITDYSIEELKKELERKKKLGLEIPPQQLSNKNFDELIKSCSIYITNVANECFDDNDQEDVFEKAIEAVYGEDIWVWTNSH